MALPEFLLAEIKGLQLRSSALAYASQGISPMAISPAREAAYTGGDFDKLLHDLTNAATIGMSREAMLAEFGVAIRFDASAHFSKSSKVVLPDGREIAAIPDFEIEFANGTRVRSDAKYGTTSDIAHNLNKYASQLHMQRRAAEQAGQSDNLPGVLVRYNDSGDFGLWRRASEALQSKDAPTQRKEIFETIIAPVLQEIAKKSPALVQDALSRSRYGMTSVAGIQAGQLTRDEAELEAEAMGQVDDHTLHVLAMMKLTGKDRRSLEWSQYRNVKYIESGMESKYQAWYNSANDYTKEVVRRWRNGDPATDFISSRHDELIAAHEQSRLSWNPTVHAVKAADDSRALSASPFHNPIYLDGGSYEKIAGPDGRVFAAYDRAHNEIHFLAGVKDPQGRDIVATGMAFKVLPSGAMMIGNHLLPGGIDDLCKMGTAARETFVTNNGGSRGASLAGATLRSHLGGKPYVPESGVTAAYEAILNSSVGIKRKPGQSVQEVWAAAGGDVFFKDQDAKVGQRLGAVLPAIGGYYVQGGQAYGPRPGKTIKDMQKQNREYVLSFGDRQFAGNIRMAGAARPEELTLMKVFASGLETFTSVDPGVAETMKGTTPYKRYIPIRTGVTFKREGLAFDPKTKSIDLGGFVHQEDNWDNITDLKARVITRGAKSFIELTGTGSIDPSRTMVKEWLWGKSMWMSRELGMENRGDVEAMTPIGANVRQNAYVALMTKYRGTDGVERMRQDLEAVMRRKDVREILASTGYAVSGDDEEGALKMLRSALDSSVQRNVQGKDEFVWGHNPNDPMGSKLVDATLYFAAKDIFQAGIKMQTFERMLPYEGYLRYKMNEGKGPFKIDLVDDKGNPLNLNKEQLERWAKRPGERMRTRILAEGFQGEVGTLVTQPFAKGEGVITMEEAGQVLKNAPYFSDQDFRVLRDKIVPGWFAKGAHKRETSEAVLKAHLMSRGAETPDSLGIGEGNVIEFDDLRAKLFEMRDKAGVQMTDKFFELLADKKALREAGLVGKFIRMDNGNLYLAPLDALNALTTFPESERTYEGDKDRKWSESVGRRGQLNAMLNQFKRLALMGSNDDDYAGGMKSFYKAVEDIATSRTTIQNVGATHVGAEGMYVMDTQLPANVLAAGPETLMSLFGTSNIDEINRKISTPEGLLAMGIRRPNYSSHSAGVALKVMRLADFGYGKRQEGMAVSPIRGDLFQGDDDGDRMAAWALSAYKAGDLKNQFENMGEQMDARFGYGKMLRRMEMMYSNLTGREVKFGDIGEYVEFADRLYKATGAYSELGKANKPFAQGTLDALIGEFGKWESKTPLDDLRQEIFKGEVMGHGQMGHAYNQFKRGLTLMLGMMPSDDVVAQHLTDRLSYNSYQTALDKATFSGGLRDLVSLSTNYNLRTGVSRDFLSPTPGQVPENDPAPLSSRDKVTPTLQRRIIQSVLRSSEFRGGGMNARWIDDVARMVSADESTRAVIRRVLVTDKEVGATIRAWQNTDMNALLEKSGEYKSLAQQYDKQIGDLIEKNSFRLADEINRRAFGGDVSTFATSGGLVSEPVMAQVFERWDRSGKQGNITGMVDSRIMQNLIDAGKNIRSYVQYSGGKTGDNTTSAYMQLKRANMLSTGNLSAGTGTLTTLGRKLRGLQDTSWNAVAFADGTNNNDLLSMMGNVDEAALLQRIRSSSSGLKAGDWLKIIRKIEEVGLPQGGRFRMTPEMQALSTLMNEEQGQARYNFEFTGSMFDPTTGDIDPAKVPAWAGQYFGGVAATLRSSVATAPGAAHVARGLSAMPFEQDSNLFEWLTAGTAKGGVFAVAQNAPTQQGRGPAAATQQGPVVTHAPGEFRKYLEDRREQMGPRRRASVMVDENGKAVTEPEVWDEKSFLQFYGPEATPEFFARAVQGTMPRERIERMAAEDKITPAGYQLATGLQKGSSSAFSGLGKMADKYGGVVHGYMKGSFAASGQDYNGDWFEQMAVAAQRNQGLDVKLGDLGKSVDFVSGNFKSMAPYLKAVSENFQKMSSTDLGKVDEMFGHVRAYDEAVKRGMAGPVPGMDQIVAGVNDMQPNITARILGLKTGLVPTARRGGGGGMFGGGGEEDPFAGSGEEGGGFFSRFAPSGRGVFTGDWGAMYFGMLNLQRAWKYTGGGVTDAMTNYAKYAQQQQYAGSMLGEGVGYTGPVQTVMGAQSNLQRFTLGLGRAGWDSWLGKAATNAAGMLGNNDPDNPGWMQNAIANAAPIIGVPLVLAVASGVAKRLGMGQNIQGLLNFVPGVVSQAIGMPISGIGPALSSIGTGAASGISGLGGQQYSYVPPGFNVPTPSYGLPMSRGLGGLGGTGLFSAANMGSMGASLGALSVGQFALLTGGSLAAGGLAGNTLMNALQGTSYTLPQRAQQAGDMFQQWRMMIGASTAAGESRDPIGVLIRASRGAPSEAFSVAMRDELERAKTPEQRSFDKMYGGFAAVSSEMQKYNPASDPNQAKAIAAEYGRTFGRSTEQMRGDISSGFAGETRFLSELETVPPELRKSALQYALAVGRSGGLKYGDKGFAELGQRYLEMSPAAQFGSEEALARSSAFLETSRQFGVDVSGLTRAGLDMGTGRTTPSSRLEQMNPQELMELNRLASGDRLAWSRQGAAMGHPEWVTMEADTGYNLGTTRFAGQLTDATALQRLKQYGSGYLVSQFNQIAPTMRSTGRGGSFDMHNADYAQPSTVNIGGEQLELNMMYLQDEQLQLTRENQQFQFGQQRQQWGLGYLQRAAGGGISGSGAGALQEKAAAMAGPQAKLLLEGQSFTFELGGQARSIQMTGSGQWQFELAGQQLSRMQQSVQFGFQREQLALSDSQFNASQGLQRQRMETEAAWGMQSLTRNFGRQQTQFGWAREDLAFQGEGRALQFGWNMEDIDLNMRYATGRERRQLARQRERAAISYGRDVSQQEREEGRLDVREGWAKQDYPREMAQAKQRLEWARAEMALQSTQHAQNMDLSRRRLQAEEEYFTITTELQDARTKVEQQYYDLVSTKDLEMITNAQAFAEKVNAINTAMETLSKSSDAIVTQFGVDMSTKLGVALQGLVDSLVTYTQQLTLGYSGGIGGLRTRPPGREMQ